MSKAKFQVAKELIQEKKYSEARSILRTIDHPTALKWLNHLDEINPPLRKSINPKLVAIGFGFIALALITGGLLVYYLTPKGIPSVLIDYIDNRVAGQPYTVLWADKMGTLQQGRVETWCVVIDGVASNTPTHYWLTYGIGTSMVTAISDRYDPRISNSPTVCRDQPED